MDFYFHARKDGVYDLICTQCFAVVLSTNDPCSIQAPETHQCIKTIHAAASIPNETRRGLDQGIRNTPVLLRRFRSVRPSLLLLGAALFLYGFPTVLEFLLIRQVSPELVVVVAGDLLGCTCIAVFFKKVRLALAVYLLMSGIEALAYGLHWLPAETLPWIADAVPTLVVLGLIQRLIQKLSRYEAMQLGNA